MPIAPISSARWMKTGLDEGTRTSGTASVLPMAISTCSISAESKLFCFCLDDEPVEPCVTHQLRDVRTP